jgi:hypothetical protein
VWVYVRKFIMYIVLPHALLNIKHHRHTSGHSHIEADAVISHLRVWAFGKVACGILGAAAASISQVIHAMEAEGPLSIWNKKTKRCHWAKVLGFNWGWREFFEEIALSTDLLGGYLGRGHAFKSQEVSRKKKVCSAC